MEKQKKGQAERNNTKFKVSKRVQEKQEKFNQFNFFN